MAVPCALTRVRSVRFEAGTTRRQRDFRRVYAARRSARRAALWFEGKDLLKCSRAEVGISRPDFAARGCTNATLDFLRRIRWDAAGRGWLQKRMRTRFPQFCSGTAGAQCRSRFLRLLRFLLFPFLPVTVAHCHSPFPTLMDHLSVLSARSVPAIAILRLGYREPGSARKHFAQETKRRLGGFFPRAAIAFDAGAERTA